MCNNDLFWSISVLWHFFPKHHQGAVPVKKSLHVHPVLLDSLVCLCSQMNHYIGSLPSKDSVVKHTHFCIIQCTLLTLHMSDRLSSSLSDTLKFYLVHYIYRQWRDTGLRWCQQLSQHAAWFISLSGVFSVCMNWHIKASLCNCLEQSCWSLSLLMSVIYALSPGSVSKNWWWYISMSH